MASAMIGGLVKSGLSAQRIHVSEPNAEKRRQFQAINVSVHASNDELSDLPTVVLAVKPQSMAEVCAQLKPRVKPGTLIISIAAGIRSQTIQHWLGQTIAVVRAMPNTPALFGLGASGVFASPEVTSAQRQQAETVLGATGIVQWFEREPDIDAVTALSGSGPAYFFRIMEAMITAAQQAGLDAAAAKRLTLQTALGAAHMALHSNLDLATLRQNVTSPGGTTERGLQVLQTHNIDSIFKQVIDAATTRSIELSQQLSQVDTR